MLYGFSRTLSNIAEKYNEKNKEDKPWFDFRKWYQVMKKSIDEKKQKWEEARAKYVVSSGFKFTCLISKSVTLYLKAKVSAVRLLSIMTFFLENISPCVLIDFFFFWCYY